IRPVPSSSGARFYPDRPDVKCVIADKVTKVLDARSASETRGQEILASAHIVMHPEDWVPPGSLVVMWQGTPMERVAEVVATAIANAKSTPESAQVWVV